MTSLFSLFLKMFLRNKGVIIMLFIVPVALVGFTYLMTSSGGGINVSVYICAYNSKLEGVLTRLLEQYKVSSIHLLHKCVNNPSKFIFDITAKTGMPTMLIILNSDKIEIYSSSLEIGATLRSYLENSLLRFFYPNLKLPVNIVLKIPETLKSAKALEQIAYARGVIMFSIMEGFFGGLLVMQAVTLLSMTGLHKKIAIFRETRRKVALAISMAGLILVVTAGIVLLLTSSLILRVNLRYTLLNPNFWLAYVLTYLFLTGIVLIVTSLVANSKTNPASAQSITMMLLLILMFLSEIFIPLEVMPKPITKIAQLVPTTTLVTQVYLSIIGGTLSIEKLTYSIATTLATFALGILLFNPYKKQ